MVILFSLISVCIISILGLLIFIDYKIAIDIELNQSKEQLRHILLKYRSSIDNERRHITRVLHDNIGYKLILSKLILQDIKERVNEEDKVKIDELLCFYCEVST